MCFIFDISPVIKLSIPIVAILDTNSNPEGISFPIPGNDDARRSIDLYCNLLKETINNAKKENPESKNFEESLEEKKPKEIKDVSVEKVNTDKKLN